MRGYIIRKILVVLLMILPVFSWSGCKKQKKCGCGKDILFSLDEELLDYSDIVYNSDGTNAYFSIGYSTYYFCNPSEMHAAFKDISADDQILLSGDAFWECSYLMNASNSYYYSLYKVYNIQVTGLKSYLYGKK
ncbi:MAG: hypothetical protein IQL11_15885 [Bacteroidales bacterium]|nr:hypothetical protein [Bacteroidales bacterium]